MQKVSSSKNTSHCAYDVFQMPKDHSLIFLWYLWAVVNIGQHRLLQFFFSVFWSHRLAFTPSWNSIYFLLRVIIIVAVLLSVSPDEALYKCFFKLYYITTLHKMLAFISKYTHLWSILNTTLFIFLQYHFCILKQVMKRYPFILTSMNDDLYIQLYFFTTKDPSSQNAVPSKQYLVMLFITCSI